MDDFCRWESIEPSGGSIAISADVLGINQVLNFQLRQFLGKRDRIERIAGLAKDSADLGFPFFERFEVILAMIENNAGKGVIDAVVNVIAPLAIPDGFANNARHGSRRRGHEKSPWLGENLQVLREKAVQFSINLPGQHAERLDV